MSYKIPKEDLVIFIIKKILKEKKIIKSQKILLEEVQKELKSSGIDYRIDAKRLRKIAINKLKIHVEIEYRETNRESQNLKTCPVCGNKLVNIKNLTLENQTVFLGKKCTKCPYWTGKNIRVPKRYIFIGDGEYDKQKKRESNNSKIG